MHNYPLNDSFLYHNKKLHKITKMYLKYDNMHTVGIINAFICINNHVNSCIISMLSIIHDYLCILRHKRFYSYACYHIYECLSIML